MAHQRRTARLELSFPVLVEAGGELRRLLAANVSERGMLFVSPEPYPVGSLLRVTFSLPSTDLELTVKAEVLHVTWVVDPADDAGCFRVGLGFVEFEQGAIDPPLRCLPC
jgi:hypothetical protein